MERQMKTRTDVIYSSTISEIVQKGNELITKYPHLTMDRIEVDVVTEWDCSYVALQYETPETDDEMKARRDWDNRVKASRREQYERLKKEFEK